LPLHSATSLATAYTELTYIIYFAVILAALVIVALWFRRFGGTGSTLDPEMIIKNHRGKLLAVVALSAVYLTLGGLCTIELAPQRLTYTVGEEAEAEILVVNPLPVPVYYFGHYRITRYNCYSNGTEIKPVSNAVNAARAATEAANQQSRSRWGATWVPPYGSTLIAHTWASPAELGEITMTAEVERDLKTSAATCTVNVTDALVVTLDHPGVSLDLEVVTNQTTFKRGDAILVYLVIRNDNPYPVKVPVYENFTKSMIPLTSPRREYMIEWIPRYFRVEPRSYKVTWTDTYTMRPPAFTVYNYVDGHEASLSVEVTE
jgi:hypothetical protein